MKNDALDAMDSDSMDYNRAMSVDLALRYIIEKLDDLENDISGCAH